MSKSLTREAARAELARRRAGVGKTENVLRRILSEKQRAFIDDPSRFKLARCPRRSGKSHADAIYLILECLRAPKTPTLYLGLTRESAKGAVWDAICTILQEMRIPHVASVSGPRIDFPNGSFIQLLGADQQNAVNRIRGRKFKLAIVDEMGFYSAADYLIEALMPTLADYAGTLAMTSSPGYVPAGFFYDADVGTKRSAWSQHSWTLLDNPLFQGPAKDPKFKNRGEEELYTICTMQFGGDRNHPVFQREYLGMWTFDSSSMIYPYSMENFSPPPLGDVPIKYVLGIGVEPNYQGCVVMRYSEQSRYCQIEHASHTHFQNLADFAAHVKGLVDQYRPTFSVCDSSTYSSLMAKELNSRYDLHMQALKNIDEMAYQKLMATDILNKNIRIAKETTMALTAEWSKLMKDENGDLIEEMPHPCSRAALALYSKLYTAVLQSPNIPPTEEERMIESVLAQIREEKEEMEDWSY